jgi:hypothetical protein
MKRLVSYLLAGTFTLTALTGCFGLGSTPQEYRVKMAKGAFSQAYYLAEDNKGKYYSGGLLNLGPDAVVRVSGNKTYEEADSLVLGEDNNVNFSINGQKKTVYAVKGAVLKK